jgi:hypothetical protein
MIREKFAKYIRWIPYTALALALVGSVWLLHEYSEDITFNAASGSILEDQFLYDSIYQESRYFFRQVQEDQLKRSREVM